MIPLDTLARGWAHWMVDASWQLLLLVAIVALIDRAARFASPRFLHALWLLVLLKVFLPPSLATPFSVGQWGITPLIERAGLSASSDFLSWAKTTSIAGDAQRDDASPGSASALPLDAIPLPAFLMAVWAAGALLFLAAVAWRYAKLHRAISGGRAIDEGPLRIALEQIALDLGLRHVPDLVSTSTVTSPFLFGISRPRIVLPDRMLAELSEVELRAVLTHELVHWLRYDTWIGWLQVAAQAAFWFHPFVWWANRQLRHERECACDEAVLRLGDLTPEHYGESVVRVLTASRGRSLAMGSLVGVFERGDQLQERLEHIMNFTPEKRRFGWPSRLALAAFAILFLPMAPAVPAAPETPDPLIVKTNPAVGATGIDPALKEISVTFDRDMQQGMSWTGGPPDFPPIDESRKLKWTNARTCVLPVKLAAASYYRVGINSSTSQNFKSAAGTPARPSAIYFTTKGAKPELENQLRAPEVVSLEPNNGAMDVDPKTDTLKVTFNMPMNEGASWTILGDSTFPKLSEGKKLSWSADGLTCRLPVALEPAHDYELGLNNASHINFQSKAGVPLKPIIYRFRTK